MSRVSSLVLAASMAGPIVSALAMAALSQTAMSQTSWPTKPIRFVVPFAPGGIADLAARIVGAKLTESWGQQVVVENKPGGNATIGMSTVAKAAPDGYTFVVATAGDFTLATILLKDIPYDIERDFAVLTTLTDSPTGLAAHVGSPYKTFADVVAAAKANPGKIPTASPGNGGIQQLHLEWMALGAGIKLQHIPYKGGAPAGAAVAAGDVPLGLLAVTSALPHLKAGRVQMLAQTAAKRSKFIADVPTMQELGIPDIDGANWTAIAAPKATPAAILDKLHAEIVRVLALPDVIERLQGSSAIAVPATPAELAARIKRETAAIRPIVEKSGMTAE